MFGKHAVFIIPSYAITALVIAALVVWIAVTYRQRRREVERMEDGETSRSRKKASQ